MDKSNSPTWVLNSRQSYISALLFTHAEELASNQIAVFCTDEINNLVPCCSR